MQSDREQLAVYILLGRSFIEAPSYDAKGAFILLHSISVGLSQATPEILDAASHLHMVAALGGSKRAGREARASMARVVATLELLLLMDAAAET